MRSPVGITLGWLVQALTWASALLVTAMIGVAVVFTLLWVVLLVQGAKVDRVVAERERQPVADTTTDTDTPTDTSSETDTATDASAGTGAEPA